MALHASPLSTMARHTVESDKSAPMASTSAARGSDHAEHTGAWKSSREDRRGESRELPDRREMRRGVHYHNKRHMLPENESKQRRSTTQKTRDVRKKPSGHLAPLEEDDMDNDEVVSVAIGPPPIRPKYEKSHWKHTITSKVVTQNVTNTTASNIVKDVLVQLGRELLTKQVSEDFIFGQYVGNSMKNLTSEIKLKMQHEVLELIVKYQKWNRGETPKPPEEKPVQANPLVLPMPPKDIKPDKKFIPANETEDTWPDFSNLAKIVG
ncbi:uncharacterized protein LOC142974913 [Anticarsia gemmatalis]|uniref:uncharacterized protein LOC142974913 n=1 Tax=Anticarsia gemmatalis TaxID=129554 RepID=UPI003F76093A